VKSEIGHIEATSAFRSFSEPLIKGEFNEISYKRKGSQSFVNIHYSGRSLSQWRGKASGFAR